MVNTPNHKYNAPDAGTSDWHIPLNKNFEQLDVDVEIRGSEADKGQYEPKEGAKYEATDSGAVYYGNGDTWVLADRKVGKLESESSVTGEHLKAGDSSVAVVAPSVGSAYNKIKHAIDDGHRDIIVAEEIEENNIYIPRTEKEFRLEGRGSGTYQRIIDPCTGDPVIAAEKMDTRGITAGVTLRNLKIASGDNDRANGGIAIKGVNNIEEPDGPANAAGGWNIYNVRSEVGPVMLAGPRNLCYKLEVDNWSENKFPIPLTEDPETGEPVMERIAGIFIGTTFGMYGGSFSSKTSARTAAFFDVGGYSITGGVTFSNAKRKPNNEYSSNLMISGSTRGFIGGISTEGSVDYDVQFGLEEAKSGPGVGCSATTILGPSAFNQLNVVKSSGNVKILNPLNDIHVVTDPNDSNSNQDATITIESKHNVTADMAYPFHVTHLQPTDERGVNRLGGNRGSPSTQVSFQIHESAPYAPTAGGMVIADGDSWDPDEDGNAEIVVYNGNEWIEIVDLQTKI